MAEMKGTMSAAHLETRGGHLVKARIPAIDDDAEEAVLVADAIESVYGTVGVYIGHGGSGVAVELHEVPRLIHALQCALAPRGETNEREKPRPSLGEPSRLQHPQRPGTRTPNGGGDVPDKSHTGRSRVEVTSPTRALLEEVQDYHAGAPSTHFADCYRWHAQCLAARLHALDAVKPPIWMGEHT